VQFYGLVDLQLEQMEFLTQSVFLQGGFISQNLFYHDHQVFLLRMETRDVENDIVY